MDQGPGGCGLNGQRRRAVPLLVWSALPRTHTRTSVPGYVWGFEGTVPSVLGIAIPLRPLRKSRFRERGLDLAFFIPLGIWVQ